ncbi:MAG: hypothetical protein AAB796_00300, partial [Patescibacteria group bacterium]
ESIQKMKENPTEYPEAFVGQYQKVISALREHIESKSGSRITAPSEAVEATKEIPSPAPEAPATPETPLPKTPTPETLTAPVEPAEIEKSQVETGEGKDEEGPASLPPESPITQSQPPVVLEVPEEQPEREVPVVQEVPTESKAPTPETPTAPLEPEKTEESRVDIIGEAKKISYTTEEFLRNIPPSFKNLIHSENAEAFRAYGIDKHIMALNGDINLYEEEQALARLETLNEKAHASAAAYPKQFLESFDDVIVVLAQKVNAGNEHLLGNLNSKFTIDKSAYDALKSMTVKDFLDTITLIQDEKISELPKNDPVVSRLLDKNMQLKFEDLAGYIQSKNPDSIDKELSLDVYMKTVGIPDGHERNMGVVWKGLHGAGRVADMTGAAEQLQRISEIAVLENLRDTYGISHEQYGLVYHMDIGTFLNGMDDIKFGKSGEAYVSNDIIRRVLHEKQASFEKLAEFIKTLNPSLSERTLSLDEYLLEKLPAKTL